MLTKYFLVVMISVWGNSTGKPPTTFDMTPVYGKENCERIGKAIQDRFTIANTRYVDVLCVEAQQ